MWYKNKKIMRDDSMVSMRYGRWKKDRSDTTNRSSANQHMVNNDPSIMYPQVDIKYLKDSLNDTKVEDCYFIVQQRGRCKRGVTRSLFKREQSAPEVFPEEPPAAIWGGTTHQNV